MKTILTTILFAALALGQTTINGGRTILGAWDASGAAATKPNKIGTALPATCGVGETFFDTDATAGSNVYGCTATNTWTLQGGSYTLPIAAAGTLGGIRVGSGLSIDGSGVLSASGSSVVCDPGNPAVSCLVEEFMTGTTTSGQIGTHGWKFNGPGSGTFAFHNVTTGPITNRPGVVTFTSTTTANSGGVLAMANTSSTAVVNLSDLLNQEWEVAWIAKLESTADARFRIGIGTGSPALVPSTGEATFMIRFDTDAAYSDNTKNTTGSWVAQFCGYSSGTCADTAGVYSVFNITPDTNWHRFRIYRSGTTVYFQIDANTPKTMCASGCDMTTPTISGLTTYYAAPWTSFGISSTTQRKAYYDWALFKMTGLTRY